jgi:hypothetical protein
VVTPHIKTVTTKGRNMDLLKTILGDELYNQVTEKINAHNGDEANKDNQFKLANLAKGEYVGKGKHDALQAMLDSKTGELDTANQLIADLKKGTKDNQDLQGKISTYETQVADLQKQLLETKIDYAAQLAIRDAGGSEVDFLVYKLKALAEGKLELDDNDKIKGIDEMMTTLKTQSPAMFDTGTNRLEIEEIKLPDSNNNKPGVTQEQFNKMGYQSRLKLKQEQPEVYAEMTNKI